ncbi:MAG: hypothetical protein LBO06_04090 [Bacteroidales bacterium]|jgi:hypothetical protein|nr:hypothetical protein [Bacteroidales bacterium]
MKRAINYFINFVYGVSTAYTIVRLTSSEGNDYLQTFLLSLVPLLLSIVLALTQSLLKKRPKAIAGISAYFVILIAWILIGKDFSIAAMTNIYLSAAAMTFYLLEKKAKKAHCDNTAAEYKTCKNS